MSFKNFYLTEDGDVEPKKNQSLLGGKLYSGVSNLSQGLTGVTKNIIGKWDETIAALEKKGPLGKKIADSVKNVQGKINYFKEKNPAAYSMLMNMAAGAAGAAAGTAAGKVTKDQVEQFKQYIEKIKSGDSDTDGVNKDNAKQKYDPSKDPDMRDDEDEFGDSKKTKTDVQRARDSLLKKAGGGNAEGLVDGGYKVTTSDGQEVVVKPDKNGNVDYYYKGDPEFDNAKTAKSVMQNNSVEYSKNTIMEMSNPLKISPEDQKAYDDAVKSVKGLLSNVWTMLSTPGKDGGSSMVDKGALASGAITALANPSPSVLGAIALQATLNALDKVDKRQMPASKYIATVVNKVKDEKKKKEMLASFIRMRSKQI